MLTLMTLFALALTGMVIMVVVGLTVAAGKFVFFAIAWPLKLLLLPLLLVFFIVKIVLIITFFTVAAALLIPLVIIGLLVAAPLFAFAALT